MDFDLSDDQVALRDGARDLLDGFAAPERVRAHTASGDAYDRALWDAMVEQGWLAIETPEDRGGVGLGAVEVAVLVEELGRHAAPAPFVPTVLAVDALARAGEEGWVDRLLGGDALACVAWDAAAPVPYAPSADIAIVCEDDGVYACELDERPPREPAMDLTRELGWLRFERTAARRIGDAAERERLLDRGATFTSADLLGGAARALDMAVEYAKERVQFGKPIGSFQAVKHMLASAKVKLEYARPVVMRAAYSVAHGSPQRALHVSMAKLVATEAARFTARQALQAHGAIGYTWEQDLHIWMRRAWSLDQAWGRAPFHLARVRSAVLDGALPIGPGQTFLGGA